MLFLLLYIWVFHIILLKRNTARNEAELIDSTPFYRKGNWGPEGWKDLFMITQPSWNSNPDLQPQNWQLSLIPSTDSHIFFMNISSVPWRAMTDSSLSIPVALLPPCPFVFPFTFSSKDTTHLLKQDNF